jgi:hypothetical protein
MIFKKIQSMQIQNATNSDNTCVEKSHVKHLSRHPKSVKIKHLTTNINKINKVHSRIDDAFSILTVTDNVSKAVLPHFNTKYDMTLHYFQDNFLIASKVIILSKLFVFMTRIDNRTKDNVAIYTLALFVLIFVAGSFPHTPL